MIETFAQTTLVSYPWYKVWTRVWFRPSLKTYEEILADPNAKAWRAVVWMSLVTLLISTTVWLIMQNSRIPSLLQSPIFVIGLPVIVVITFLITTAGYHLVSKWLGGRGTYNHLVYACGAFGAPATLIAALIYVIFFIGLAGAIAVRDLQLSSITLGVAMILLGCMLLIVVVAIYSIFQYILAIKAVEQISSGRAFAAWLIVSLLSYFLSNLSGG